MIRRGSEAWEQAREAWQYFVDQGKEPSAGAVDRRALYHSGARSHPFVVCSECQYEQSVGDTCVQGLVVPLATHECHRYTPKPHMGRNKELLKFVQRMNEQEWK